MGWLEGKKTYLVAVLMVAIAVVNLATGEISLVEFFTSPYVQLLLEGLGLGALRAGIKKAEK